VGISTFGLSIEPVNEKPISPFGFFLLSSDELELLDFSMKMLSCISVVDRSILVSSCYGGGISTFGLHIELVNERSLPLPVFFLLTSD
jgi:hypothetical protein